MTGPTNVPALAGEFPNAELDSAPRLSAEPRVQGAEARASEKAYSWVIKRQARMRTDELLLRIFGKLLRAPQHCGVGRLDVYHGCHVQTTAKAGSVSGSQTIYKTRSLLPCLVPGIRRANFSSEFLQTILEFHRRSAAFSAQNLRRQGIAPRRVRDEHATLQRFLSAGQIR
jgi:hypothetical protein